MPSQSKMGIPWGSGSQAVCWESSQSPLPPCSLNGEFWPMVQEVRGAASGKSLRITSCMPVWNSCFVFSGPPQKIPSFISSVTLGSMQGVAVKLPGTGNMEQSPAAGRAYLCWLVLSSPAFKGREEWMFCIAKLVPFAWASWLPFCA